MAINPQQVGNHILTKAFKGAALRLSDDPRVGTSDYAELLVGDGVPAGAYGRASGVTMLWLDKAATSTMFALWVTVDGGTNWYPVPIEDAQRFSLDWTAGVRGKPAPNADIQNAAEATREVADPDFEILGTNSDATCVAFYAEGGVTLTTKTTSGDQVILLPHLDANQSAWTQVTWGTDKETAWEATITMPATITSMIVWAGLKLSMGNTVTTDNDQVFFRYEAGVNGGEWQVISSIANVDTTTDSNVTVSANQRFHLRIVIDSSRIARAYINGTLVLTTAALTNAVDLIPYIGVQTATAGARTLYVHRQAISRAIG